MLYADVITFVRRTIVNSVTYKKNINYQRKNIWKTEENTFIYWFLRPLKLTFGRLPLFFTLDVNK